MSLAGVISVAGHSVLTQTMAESAPEVTSSSYAEKLSTPGQT